MRPARLCYPPNPDYGSGLCRRRIRLEGTEGHVAAMLTDTFHEMHCGIDHDGESVTGIAARTIRIPTTTCPAAASLLPELIGTPLAQPAAVFYGQGRARRHCTHLYDLAVLAIRHAGRARSTLIYEATVPDETDRPVEIRIERDGTPIHRWDVRDGAIVAPHALSSRTLGSGFARWASAIWSGDDLEAATILARTWLIAIGRHYLVEAVAGEPAARNSEMIGRCFAYHPDRIGDAIFMGGQVRDL